MEHFTEAKEYCQKALEIDAQNHWANQMMGSIFLIEGRLFDAEKLYLEHPENDSPEYMVVLGHVALCKQNHFDAYQSYLKSLELCKTDTKRNQVLNDLKSHIKILQIYQINQEVYKKLIDEVETTYLNRTSTDNQNYI